MGSSANRDSKTESKLLRPDHSMIGAAGEHLVLSRLLARGFLAAQAPRGVRKADIIVNFLDGGAPFLIQVKARSRGTKGWHMKAKHEEEREPDLFYCFVDFEEVNPSVHVIPSTVVAEVIAESHAMWLAAPGKNGQAHNDSEFRRLKPDSRSHGSGWMDEYLENWEQLERRAETRANKRGK